MGNQPSQPASYAVSDEELRHAPHNFYLVFGKPSIQFARDRVRGPLIYDVEVEYDADRDAVEHTATLDLACAVPRRQKFELTSAPTQTAVTGSAAPSCGFALTFRLAATAAPQRVRVLTGVTVEYRPGYGIHLASGDPDVANATCIFQTTATAELSTVVTKAAVFPPRLRPVAMEAAPNAPGPAAVQRVSYAPLVIEVDIGDTEEPIRASERPAASPTAAAAAAKSDGPSSPPSTPPLPTKKRVVQYTLLEIPAEAAEAVGAEPVRLACKVCKQLLQVGSEVYDLEDVFDMGRDEELIEPDEEEEDVCVICLTNSRDTTILPCRHMCLCSECATHLRLANNRCPLCRGNIERLMTF